MPDITAASVNASLLVPGLYPVPTPLQGWSTDDIAEWEETDVTEEMMGVDGILSMGVVLVPRPVVARFQKDSPSIPLFENWGQTMLQQLQVFFGSLAFSYPAIGRTYTCNQGALRRWKPAPDAKKLLQPRQFRLVFQ